ncbi:hypothetical protein FOZ62_028406, partial [Perkinsus olseni]
EAWIRAVVEDLSDDHPGGWFYPPDGAQDVTPNIRKYQLWPFFFWRPQNTSWARLRSPDDPSAALPCIKDHRHTVRRAGFMSQGPRKVVAREGIFYVLGERFRCTTCLGGSEESEINHDEDNPGDAKVGSRQKKKQALRFSSLHPDFLSKLPPDLISQIPAFFTYRKAIALDVLSDLRTLSVSGSASVCSARLLETQQTAYFRRRAQYELHCKEWEEASSKGRLSPFTCVKRVPPAGGFPNFGSMDHRDGWNVAASDRSREYLMAVYVQDFVIRQPTLAQELKSLSGRILKADHTRPLAGKVSSEVGVKWSYSVMNEYGEILCHAFTETDSDSQVQHLYAGLRARFDSLNVHHPRLIFVDKQCCGSTKEMIQRYFPAIQVRLDIFHLLWRFSKSCSRSSHPGHAGFMKELSQAVFKVNENDMKLLIEAIMVAFGLQDPSDAVAKLKETPSWLYKYVRRQVPAKEELEERIMAVVDAARNVAWEGELLLPPGPEGFDRCLANQLHHVRMGCVSDVDDALYEELGIVHFQGKKEAPLMAYKCYRSSSQLEGIHGWQASYLSGTNVGPLATQALVTDGIMRYNRNVRRKSDGHKAVFPLYDNCLLLRLRSSSDGQLYPNLVMNAADTGETFGLEYTAAIRREMIEIEVGEMSKESPAETVADSEDIHRFEADAMAWSIDRVLEILEQEHSVQDIQRSERHSSATRAQSTSRRISKLRMFGRNSNFLQKARPESFTLLMKQKLDDLASAIGEQDVDEIHRQYYRWFLEQKLDDPNVPILDTSRFHVEAYLTRKKMALAGATAAVPDVVTAARRTRMANVLASGPKAVTPAVSSQREAPRQRPRPDIEPGPPRLPEKDEFSPTEVTGIRCGLCNEVRKGTHCRPNVIFEGKSYVGPWYCPRFDGPLDEWKATKQMKEFLRIRKAKEE